MLFSWDLCSLQKMLVVPLPQAHSQVIHRSRTTFTGEPFPYWLLVCWDITTPLPDGAKNWSYLILALLQLSECANTAKFLLNAWLKLGKHGHQFISQHPFKVPIEISLHSLPPITNFLVLQFCYIQHFQSRTIESHNFSFTRQALLSIYRQVGDLAPRAHDLCKAFCHIFAWSNRAWAVNIEQFFIGEPLITTGFGEIPYLMPASSLETQSRLLCSFKQWPICSLHYLTHPTMSTNWISPDWNKFLAAPISKDAW